MKECLGKTHALVIIFLLTQIQINQIILLGAILWSMTLNKLDHTSFMDWQNSEFIRGVQDLSRIVIVRQNFLN